MNGLTDTSGRAAMAGLAGAGMSRAYNGSRTVTLPRMNTTVPLYVAVGGACAAGSLVSQATHDFILPALSTEERFSESAPALLNAVSAAGGTAGALAVGVDPRVINELGYAQVIGFGLLSSAVGDYAWSMVKPMVTM